MDRDIIIQKLVSTDLLTADQAKLAVRASFKCEYCDLDFLASPENYKQWQWDHIVPRCGTGSDDYENLAAACHTCNVCFKSTWNPASVTGLHASRPTLIATTREYISKQKLATESAYLERYRAILERE